MAVEQIAPLTKVDEWPTRKLPQDQFDTSVKLSMDQMSQMTGQLNDDFIPKVNAINTRVQTNADNAKKSETNAKTSETNSKGSETRAKTSEGIATSAADRASVSATQAANSAAQTAIDAKEAKAAADKAVAATGVDVATKNKIGLVKPDNKTLTVETDGTLKVIGGAGGQGIVSTPVFSNIGSATSNSAPLTFTVTASSNLIAPRQISRFVYSIQELGISEKSVNATNNAANISVALPASIQIGTVLHINVLAYDSDGCQSDIGTHSVTVQAALVKAPTISLPTAGAQVLRTSCTIATSAFAIQSYSGSSAVSDTHAASQYRIRNEANEIVYDSGEVASLTRITITNLSASLPTDVNYKFEARHKGANLGWSGWSNQVTAKIIAKSPFSNKIEFLDPGNFVFKVPANVNQLRVLVVGGGAKGEAGKAGEAAGSVDRQGGVDPSQKNGKQGGAGGRGGKGGGIISAIINVTPGASIPVKVGDFGQSSSFGAFLQCTAGSLTARGTGIANLGSTDELICNLASTPAGKYCRSLSDMSENKWVNTLMDNWPTNSATLIGNDGQAATKPSGAVPTGGAAPSGTTGGKGGTGGDSTAVYSSEVISEASLAGDGGSGGAATGVGGAGGTGGSAVGTQSGIYQRGGASAGNGGAGGSGNTTGGNGAKGGTIISYDFYRSGRVYVRVNDIARGSTSHTNKAIMGGKGGRGGDGKTRGGNGGQGGDGYVGPCYPGNDGSKTASTYYSMYTAEIMSGMKLAGDGGDGGDGNVTGGNGGQGGYDKIQCSLCNATVDLAAGNGGNGGRGGSQGGHGGKGGDGGASLAPKGLRNGGRGGNGGEGAKGGNGGAGGKGGPANSSNMNSYWPLVTGTGGDGGNGGPGLPYGGCGGNGGMGGRGGNFDGGGYGYGGMAGNGGDGGDAGIGGDGGDGGAGGYSGYGDVSCKKGGTGGTGGDGGKACVVVFY